MYIKKMSKWNLSNARQSGGTG